MAGVAAFGFRVVRAPIAVTAQALGSTRLGHGVRAVAAPAVLVLGDGVATLGTHGRVTGRASGWLERVRLVAIAANLVGARAAGAGGADLTGVTAFASIPPPGGGSSGWLMWGVALGAAVLATAGTRPLSRVAASAGGHSLRVVRLVTIRALPGVWRSAGPTLCHLKLVLMARSAFCDRRRCRTVGLVTRATAIVVPTRQATRLRLIVAAGASGHGHGRGPMQSVALLTRARVWAIAVDRARVATGAGRLYRRHDELVRSVAGGAPLVWSRTGTAHEPGVLGVALAASAAVRQGVSVRPMAPQAPLASMLWGRPGSELSHFGMMAIGTHLDGQFRGRMGIVTADAVLVARRCAGEMPLLVLMAGDAFGASGWRTVDVVTLQAGAVLLRAASE